MRRLKFILDRKYLESVYLSFIRAVLEYGDRTWANCTQYEEQDLDKIQNEAARIVTWTTILVSFYIIISRSGLGISIRQAFKAFV